MIEQYDQDREDELTEGHAAAPSQIGPFAVAPIDARILMAARTAHDGRTVDCPLCIHEPNHHQETRGYSPAVRHWARVVSERTIRMCLTEWTYRASCGATWTEQVDSGD